MVADITIELLPYWIRLSAMWMVAELKARSSLFVLPLPGSHMYSGVVRQMVETLRPTLQLRRAASRTTELCAHNYNGKMCICKHVRLNTAGHRSYALTFRQAGTIIGPLRKFACLAQSRKHSRVERRCCKH